MYLTYEEYAGMGGGADAADFERLEAMARRMIDRATHNRLAGEVPVRDAVKRCAYALIENTRAEEALEEIAAGREIASMSNDGVSVTFSGESGAGTRTRQERILRTWLDGELSARGVNLMYAGMDG